MYVHLHEFQLCRREMVLGSQIAAHLHPLRLFIMQRLPGFGCQLACLRLAESASHVGNFSFVQEGVVGEHSAVVSLFTSDGHLLVVFTPMADIHLKMVAWNQENGNATAGDEQFVHRGFSHNGLEGESAVLCHIEVVESTVSKSELPP